MKIKWTRSSLNDLHDIVQYIANDNTTAARSTAGRIRDAVNHLLDSPEMGRPGRVSGTRELIIAGTPFIIPYRVNIKANVIDILRVLHTSRKWPDHF